MSVDAEAPTRICALATDFPRLWHDPHTPDRERKRMVRLLLEDVTLIKTAGRPHRARPFSRWGDHHAHAGPSLTAWQLRETSTEIVALIDQLLGSHGRGHCGDPERSGGICSGTGQPFHPASCTTPAQPPAPLPL